MHAKFQHPNFKTVQKTTLEKDEFDDFASNLQDNKLEKKEMFLLTLAISDSNKITIDKILTNKEK